MSSIVPSYLAKLDRAEYHLADLKAAIERYGGTDKATRPYTVRTSKRGRRTIHTLHFTRSAVNTHVPLIAADAIYNLRSSLDHLMGAIVPSRKRDSVMFPIFFRGVWNAPPPGESQQRVKDRQRWMTISRAAPHEAVTFLRRLQPPDDPPNQQTPHALRLLNQLSNKDRHSRLPVFADGVEGLLVRWRLPNGDFQDAIAAPNPDHLFENGAEFKNVPRGAVYEQSYGPPRVVIKTALTNEHGKVNLPAIDFVANTLSFIRETVLPGLIPYVGS